MGVLANWWLFRCALLVAVVSALFLYCDRWFKRNYVIVRRLHLDARSQRAHPDLTHVQGVVISGRDSNLCGTVEDTLRLFLNERYGFDAGFEIEANVDYSELRSIVRPDLGEISFTSSHERGTSRREWFFTEAAGLAAIEPWLQGLPFA